MDFGTTEITNYECSICSISFKDCSLDEIAFAGSFGLIPVGFCLECWSNIRSLVGDHYDLPNNPGNSDDLADAKENALLKETINSLAESKTLPNNPENSDALAPVSISEIDIDREAELQFEQKRIAELAKDRYLKMDNAPIPSNETGIPSNETGIPSNETGIPSNETGIST